MRRFLFIFFLVLCFAPPTWAQEITTEPICFTIRNEAPYKIYGELRTNYFTAPDGTEARHSGTFNLEKAGTLHEEEGYPMDRREFCSQGPFYPGRQLELIIRTLIPVFSCKTNIEIGEIVIQGKRLKEGGTKTWATCY